MNETVDIVFAREAGNQLGLMFRQPPREIIGHSDIERPIALACENIDEERHRLSWVPALRRITS